VNNKLFNISFSGDDMSKHLALSVLGKDRPGIVASITKDLFEAGCNIEDSSMTLLRSEFAMILLVSLGKTTTLEGLRKKFKALSDKTGLSVFLKPISNKEGQTETSQGSPHIIAVYGADKPGIVYGVSSLLAKNRINITDVQTTYSANANTYTMLLEARLPRAVSLAAAKKILTALGARLGVTITIQAVDTPQL